MHLVLQVAYITIISYRNLMKPWAYHSFQVMKSQFKQLHYLLVLTHKSLKQISR